MGVFARTFFKGLIAFLPIFVTLYVVYAIGAWFNRVTNEWLAWVWPGAPEIPGLGVVFAIAVIYALGILVSTKLTRWIYFVAERILDVLPIIGDLYQAAKQFIGLFSPNPDKAAGRAVIFEVPGSKTQMVGLLMREDLGDLPDGLNVSGNAAVYLPMGYQLGGYTVFVPKSWLKPLDLPVETAMRETLTAWLPPATATQD